jgi:hypothetical protein
VSRLRNDDGTAIVEFVWLGILLLVPLIYVVLAAISVQRAAFATTAAAREAARVYATAGSDALGEQRAEAAVAVVMHDQGVAWKPTGRVVECGSCDYLPGSTFRVVLQSTVALPFVPTWMCDDRCVAGITVHARHTEQIDCFAGTGPQEPNARC